MSFRALRRVTARLAIFLLFFTQMAVAAYACPLAPGNDGRSLDVAAMAGMPANCEMLDSNNANLCQQHCEVGNQTATATAYVLPMAVPVLLTVAEPLEPVSALRVAALPVPRERETGPPPLILFSVLRI